MQTLYIDVYFLINFTVDLIAIYFSVVFAGVPSRQLRIFLSALFAASLAVLIVFLPENFLSGFMMSLLCVCGVTFAATRRISFFRRIKFAFCFVIFEALLGGLVQFLYGVLDKYAYKHIADAFSDVANRRLLILAIVILAAMGVLRILIKIFSARSCEKSVKIEIALLGRRVSFEAFCDTGNFAKDPLDSSPVLFVKYHSVRALFPGIDTDVLLAKRDFEINDLDLKKRMRLVPVTRGGKTVLLLGVKPDCVHIKTKKGNEEIAVTVAIDNEGGTYGGYEGLIPSAVVGDVFR